MVELFFGILIVVGVFLLMAYGAGICLGIIMFVLHIPKFLFSLPMAFYIHANHYKLEQLGYDTKLKDLPKMSEIFRFYIRLITFRRPLLP